MRLRLSGLLLAGTLAACAHTAPAPAPALDLAIVGATVINPGDAARRVGQTVLVDGGRIVAVGDVEDVRVPPGTPRVDASGRFLLPGFWDMHVHAAWDPVVRETFLPLFVANGITGVRDMGGTLEVLAQLRAGQAADDPPWPRIVAAGPILDGPVPVDPSVSLAIGGAQEARDAVARLAAVPVDFIKVYTMLPPEAYRAVVDEAARWGLPVAGHIPYGISVQEAASGMRSVEHLRAETGGMCADVTPQDCEAGYAALRTHHVWQTPTLVARRARARIDDPALVEDPRLAYVPGVVRAMWLQGRDSAMARLSTADLQSRRDDFARESAAAGALPARGLPVLAGSDAGASFVAAGFGLHDELALLVDAGLAPMQALQAATSEAAAYLGRDDVGAVATGAAADLVLLRGDPSVDIGHTRDIEAVVLRGRLLGRPELDALLEAVRESAGDSP